MTNPEPKVSEKARELAEDLSRDHADIYAPQIQSYLSELLEAWRKLESQMLGAAYMDERTQKKCAHAFAAILSKWEPK